jgi:hydrogenase nickel incorporation protein HypA/HybF
MDEASKRTPCPSRALSPIARSEATAGVRGEIDFQLWRPKCYAHLDGGFARDDGGGERIVHELGIATEIYESCRTAVDRSGSGRLQSVKIAVGELSAVEPECLRFAWEALVAGGPDAGCALEVEWRPARQFCPQCGQVKPRPETRWLRLCPDCWQPLRIDGGDELDVLEVSFEPREHGPEETS